MIVVVLVEVVVVSAYSLPCYSMSTVVLRRT